MIRRCYWILSRAKQLHRVLCTLKQQTSNMITGTIGRIVVDSSYVATGQVIYFKEQARFSAIPVLIATSCNHDLQRGDINPLSFNLIGFIKQQGPYNLLYPSIIYQSAFAVQLQQEFQYFHFYSKFIIYNNIQYLNKFQQRIAIGRQFTKTSAMLKNYLDNIFDSYSTYQYGEIICIFRIKNPHLRLITVAYSMFSCQIYYTQIILLSQYQRNQRFMPS
ncbi:hypothetical protein SS50377_21432 [Spironucleus salmonicida]|uniref:Uncharacterized protein n=1 Tax=Spironucleus salmonicida TaxID=348837 RepID=A0A9P8LWW5_9EUKA|nr:hypothetical protein SS50377_21432 [Spironucleus salmonicida]